jgi:hypothetical protein
VTEQKCSVSWQPTPPARAYAHTQGMVYPPPLPPSPPPPTFPHATPGSCPQVRPGTCLQARKALSTGTYLVGELSQLYHNDRHSSRYGH